MAADVEHLPDFLRPKLRIFLSADLVGSTNFKQYPRFPITDPEQFWENSPLIPSWLSPIADFYSSFAQIFRSRWTELKARVTTDYKIKITSDPVLWKANGDELLYHKDVHNRQELFVCVLAWKDAVQEYREKLRKLGPLDLKATAWTAGFPITNVEIAFEPNLSIDPKNQFPDDPRLQQFYLLSTFYKNKENSNLLLDFLGPSMDTGFRLATRATPRKMILSVDLAYLLSTTHLPDQTDHSAYLKWFKIRYDGRFELKGVLGGKPYPIFWIDMRGSEKLAETDKLTESEDRILEDIDAMKVAGFCNAFYDDTSALMMRPFIVYEPDQQFGKIPEHYIACLDKLNDRWAQEKERYKGEQQALEGRGPTELVGSEATSEVAKGDPMTKLISEARPTTGC